MADKYTSLRTASRVGLAVRGHVSRADVIEQARAHYQQQLDQAAAALADLKAGHVDVFHQTGLYRVHNRKEVLDDD